MPVPKSVVTSVACPAVATAILAPNQARKAAAIFNGTDKTLYIKMGTGVSSSSYTLQMVSGAYFELQLPAYAGAIEAVATAAGLGSIFITEYTEGF